MADSEISFDALLPPQMASRAEAIGIRKAQTDFWTMLALAVLAGAFIAAGAVYSTTVLAGAAALPYGVGRLLAGIVFCLGLNFKEFFLKRNVAGYEGIDHSPVLLKVPEK